MMNVISTALCFAYVGYEIGRGDQRNWAFMALSAIMGIGNLIFAIAKVA